MKIFSVLIIMLSIATLTSGFNKATFSVFNQHYFRSKKNYELSEKRLFEVGESYLEKHAESSEQLTLAEMLPNKAKDVQSFCRSYPKDVLKYYNLKYAKNIKNIKSPVFKEFNTMVFTECKKK